MPYITINVSKPVDMKTRDNLQKKIANVIEVIPGKNASNTTINIAESCTIYNNTQPIEAAFVDVRLYKSSPEESKKAFAEEMFGILESTLDIPPSNVSMNFTEQPNWAANGSYF